MLKPPTEPVFRHTRSQATIFRLTYGDICKRIRQKFKKNLHFFECEIFRNAQQQVAGVIVERGTGVNAMAAP